MFMRYVLSRFIALKLVVSAGSSFTWFQNECHSGAMNSNRPHMRNASFRNGTTNWRFFEMAPVRAVQQEIAFFPSLSIFFIIVSTCNTFYACSTHPKHYLIPYRVHKVFTFYMVHLYPGMRCSIGIRYGMHSFWNDVNFDPNPCMWTVVLNYNT